MNTDAGIFRSDKQMLKERVIPRVPVLQAVQAIKSHQETLP